MNSNFLVLLDAIEKKENKIKPNKIYDRLFAKSIKLYIINTFAQP